MILIHKLSCWFVIGLIQIESKNFNFFKYNVIYLISELNKFELVELVGNPIM